MWLEEQEVQEKKVEKRKDAQKLYEAKGEQCVGRVGSLGKC